MTVDDIKALLRDMRESCGDDRMLIRIASTYIAEEIVEGCNGDEATAIDLLQQYEERQRNGSV